MSNSQDNCSICLGDYTKPKGLPCLHTFCEDCLQMYINKVAKNNCFNCPMCRANTKPFDPDKPIDKWAASFPTNNFVLNRNNSNLHGKHCPTHPNEILDISCKSCSVVICCKCCFSTHEKCEKTLTGINAKRIKKNLLADRDDLKVKAKPLENRLGQLEGVKQFTEKQIRQMSKELSAFISNQNKKWLDEIETAYSKESGALQKRKDTIDKITTNIEENINEISSYIGEEDQDGPKSMATFDYKPKYLSIKTDFDLSKIENFRFEINQKFVKIKDDILKENMMKNKTEASITTEIGAAGGSSIFTAGNVPNMAGKTPVRYTPGTGSIRQPLVFVTEVLFHGSPFYGVNDMIMLPDQCFLLTTAYKKTIFKFSSTGESLMKHEYSDSEAFGLCLLQDNCVAVSQPQSQKINILECRNLTENDSFSFNKSYYGLASDDKKKIFSLYRDCGLSVDVILKSNPRSTYQIIHTVNLPSFFYKCEGYRLCVVPSSGNLIVINSSTLLNVVCIDQRGAVVFKYGGDPDNRFHSISDVAVSRNFIFVADKIGNKIHRLQHQGNFVDIPLKSSDNIVEPAKIFVNNEGALAILSKTYKDPQIQIFSG